MSNLPVLHVNPLLMSCCSLTATCVFHLLTTTHTPPHNKADVCVRVRVCEVVCNGERNALPLSLFPDHLLFSPPPICLPSTPAPSAPPLQVTVLTVGNQNSTSISISWDPPPPEHQNGIIQEYKAGYCEKIDWM